MSVGVSMCLGFVASVAGAATVGANVGARVVGIARACSGEGAVDGVTTDAGGVVVGVCTPDADGGSDPRSVWLVTS